MIKHLSIAEGQYNIESGLELLNPNIIWIDIFNATKEEITEVEKYFNVELFTSQESEEIESSSKYNETEDEIGINLNFLRTEKRNHVNEPVSFILKKNFLITQREQEYKTFLDTYKKIKSVQPKNGTDVLLSILDTRIDFDADLIEDLTDKISGISKGLVKDNNLEREILLKITGYQESTISIRENIIEKQRILSAILKSKFFPQKNYEIIQVMIKDVGSLLDHTSFNFERLEFLQNTFLGLVNMEQNRIIKIFTVVTVIFMPPTLIASMYGMNFKFIPELDKPWGYPFAIGLMIISSVLTLLFFKRKRWL
ncbi:magnesium/cobalt transporter CorA [Aureibaculum sp. A20]|uniref:Magnesium transport protein CorA n=1 Tax=Aureibaculum flavum TaxID=2795986 RepID=A0ABS0WWY0_9FLAO|nr:MULTISPECIES: magnesium/cobalt transporter CorA [Aureibaculum]MBJ2176502.1 magnesium/cobalt transporter CorA [Aureibaculum flavum]